MAFPSFEQTNNPGYDEVFNKESKDKFSFFKAIGNFFFDPTSKLFDEKVQEEDFIEIFKMINSGYKLSHKQNTEYLKKFTKALNQSKDAEFLEKMLNKGVTIPDKCLIDYALHENANFGFAVYYSLYKNDADEQYPCRFSKLKELYEEKFKNDGFKRNLFLAWYKLAEDAVYDRAEYRSKKNSDNFYDWPHIYFEHKVWRPLANMKEHIFSNITEEEYLDCLSLFKKYPKTSKNIDKEDVPYVKQNSSYYDARGVPYNIEKWGTYLKNKNKHLENNSVDSKVELPAISEGVLKEIKLVYQEIQKDFSMLNPLEQLETQNIYRKRLPELLDRYQDVHQKYRNGIEDSTKNPNDMLYASLVDIQTIFNKKIDAINEQKLEKLDISSRYIKEIRKKMVK